MIGTQQGALCINCHSNGDKGFAAAGMMRTRIDALVASIDKSNGILNQAERKGMEVSKPKFELKGATDALTHARVLIHSSSTAEVDKVVGPGLEVADKGYQAGVAALGEWKFRREGLAVALVFILFLAVLVYLKVRQIERRQPTCPLIWSAPAERSGDGALDRMRLRRGELSPEMTIQSGVAASLCHRTPNVLPLFCLRCCFWWLVLPPRPTWRHRNARAGRGRKNQKFRRSRKSITESFRIQLTLSPKSLFAIPVIRSLQKTGM